mmetsp:Transcript_18265/g.18339  ORF Transcript_18265/g.18339 Transcript_18265/m.18339 type:complete len:84 (+) Transcript_18265:2460-2711(+)
MRVLPLNSSTKHSWKMCCPTWASTADRGSSSRYISAFRYTALARATRAFCPPDRLIPLSPISVSTPPGSTLISSSRADTRNAR